MDLKVVRATLAFTAVGFVAVLSGCGGSSPTGSPEDRAAQGDVPSATPEGTNDESTGSTESPISAPPALETCATYLTWDEATKVQRVLAEGISGTDDFTKAFVILYWHLLDESCTNNPNAAFSDTAHTALDAVNAAAEAADDSDAPGVFMDRLQTTFDRPEPVGGNFELTPIVHGQTVLLVVHATGWVARNAEGDLFPGLMVSWGDGMYTHANDGSASCVAQPQYVNMDYTYYFKYDYPAPGEYPISLVTDVCTGDTAGGADLVMPNVGPVTVGQ